MRQSGIAKPIVNVYWVNVVASAPAIKPASSNEAFVPNIAASIEGHIMLQVLPPSGRAIVVEYIINGSMRTTEMHHAIIDTTFDMNGVRKRGELIG